MVKMAQEKTVYDHDVNRNNTTKFCTWNRA